MLVVCNLSLVKILRFILSTLANHSTIKQHSESDFMKESAFIY